MKSNKDVSVVLAEIDASAEDVYRALIEPSEYKVWDPFRVASDVRAGGKVLWRFQGGEGGVHLAEVEPRRRWRGEFAAGPGPRTQFDLDLTPTAHGVRVTGTLRGIPTEPPAADAYALAEQGWGGWVESLKAHVEVAKGRVMTKVVEDLRVATKTVEGANVEEMIGQLEKEGLKIIQEVRSQSADAVGSVLVYHSGEPWKVEVGCVLEGNVEPEQELQVRKLAGGLIVARPYRRYSSGYAFFLKRGLEKWCSENGYKPAGPMREIYAGNIWDRKKPLMGEVQFPVKREKSA